LRLLPLRYAPGLQAAKRKKRCQRKQTRLAKQHPSGANTDPYLKTGVLGSATRATSLALLSGSFIDDQMHGFEADLLFSVKTGPSEALVYILWEHQHRE
jgi:hypothetical protein